MTPGARVAAAIDVLQQIQRGDAAEQALTRWARRSRFAGSKDRAAVRDHVFDLMRNWRRAAYFGQGKSPRQLMIGLLYLQDADLPALFDGIGHAPPPLSEQESAFPPAPGEEAVCWDLPEWLLSEFKDSLGERAAATARALQSRAPVFLRVNALKATVQDACNRLAEDTIEVVPNPLSPHALTVRAGSRRIRGSGAYLSGWVELQDAASQAVVDALPSAQKVLDFCAGGGGKSLALAARPGTEVFAHDIDPARMSDLPERARRAGAQITTLATPAVPRHAPYDLVLCDAPCSGSGAWRRAPEGKWRLSPEGLQGLTETQDAILDEARTLVGPRGTLAYATCSVLQVENEARVDAFLARHPDWSCVCQRRYDVSDHGDGFFSAHLRSA